MDPSRLVVVSAYKLGGGLMQGLRVGVACITNKVGLVDEGRLTEVWGLGGRRVKKQV